MTWFSTKYIRATIRLTNTHNVRSFPVHTDRPTNTRTRARTHTDARVNTARSNKNNSN